MTEKKNDSPKTFKTEKINNPNRKFAWMDKWVKMTGYMARLEREANGRYDVYVKDGRFVKEYPDGKVFPLNDKSQDE